MPPNLNVSKQLTAMTMTWLSYLRWSEIRGNTYGGFSLRGKLNRLIFYLKAAHPCLQCYASTAFTILLMFLAL
jgi:hypothetical protein